MLLLVDAGNTRIKWAVAESHAPLAQWLQAGAVTHDGIEQLASVWGGFDIERALLSNVAGAAVRARLEQVLQQCDPVLIPEWQASRAELGGIRNGYRQPTQLGSDRFFSAIGAHALFPQQALMVATCGTATTVDVIGADGVFRGGLILPGFGLMAGALARNTAQLPEVQAQGGAPLFADNTEDAIAAGCMAAQAGAIERAYADCLRAWPAEPPLCLLSGGAGMALSPHLAIPHRHVDNLVLPGLQLVAAPAVRN